MKTKLEVSDSRFIQGQGQMMVSVTFRAGQWPPDNVLIKIQRGQAVLWTGSLREWSEINSLVEDVTREARKKDCKLCEQAR